MLKPFFLVFLALSAFAHAPGGFTVVQATNKQVQLTWTGGEPSYVVERKSLGGVFTPLPVNTNPSSNSYTDSTIAPYESYAYRVRVPNSDPSPEIIVGPPPVGLSLASPVFGSRLRIALDSNGDPAVAYLVYAPQDDPEKSYLEFVSWNRVTYRWNDPRKVSMIGDILGYSTLARDPATNTWGIAFAKSASNPRFAISRDNGVTWSEDRILNCGDPGCAQVALAMGGGKVHIATLRNAEGIRYITGGVNDPPSAWQSQLVPQPIGGAEAMPYLDIAVDSANQPAVTFWSNTNGYNLILGFWRPGASTVIAMDTNGFQTDDPEVELKFAGLRPTILAVARRTEEYFSRSDQNLWITRDQGGAFSRPVNLPSDGNQSLGYPSLAVGSGSQLSVTATVIGGNDEGVRCGGMKVLEQISESSPWTICSPIAQEGQPYYDINHPRAIYAPHDGRYIVFMNTGVATRYPGVVVWRER